MSSFGYYSARSVALLDYLERWVNDGSPSGFGVEGQMSSHTSPLGNEPYFNPLVVEDSTLLQRECLVSNILPSPKLPLGFLIHPDMRGKWESYGLNLSLRRDVVLIPTSSGRTARVSGSSNLGYVKFDYDATLGRVNRSINRTKGLASLEMSDELIRLLRSNSFSNIVILPEYAVELVRPKGHNGAYSGLLHRDGRFVGHPESSATDTCAQLIPLFSFWSTDRKTGRDDIVLDRVFGGDPEKLALALEFSATELLDFYFSALLRAGLQLEYNAQNILVGVDNKSHPSCVCLRDFSSTEKDVTIRSSLGLSTDFKSLPYKKLEAGTDEYKKRHSFAFDFKLSQYVAAPIAELLNRFFGGRGDNLISSLRARTSDWLMGSRDDLFPEGGVWYRHPKVDLTADRPYQKCRNPLLR